MARVDVSRVWNNQDQSNLDRTRIYSECMSHVQDIRKDMGIRTPLVI